MTAGAGGSNKLASTRFQTAHDPRDSFCASLNFICDSNLWKLISFFREARINLCLINLLFLLLPPPASPRRSEETQTLHKHLARLDFFFCERNICEMKQARRAAEKSEIKLPMKIHANIGTRKEKPRRRNRRHFLNIKMTRDCWHRRRNKSSTARTGTLWLSSSFLISRIGAKRFAPPPAPNNGNFSKNYVSSEIRLSGNIAERSLDQRWGCQVSLTMPSSHRCRQHEAP